MMDVAARDEGVGEAAYFGRVREEWVWAGVSVGAFHVGYLVPGLALLMGMYLYGLVKLTEVGSARRAFYFGFGVGMACFVPQLWFFVGIFHFAAVALWGVGAIWIGFFVLMGWGMRRVVGMQGWTLALMLGVVWMGLEYFRSELYYLKFAWLTPGIAMGNSVLVRQFGVYGAGFMLTAAAAFVSLSRTIQGSMVRAVLCLIVYVVFWCYYPLRVEDSGPMPRFVAIQMEQPSPTQVIDGLDEAVSTYPDAALLVMSEYTLASPPTEQILRWCRLHERYLIVGGIQPLEPGPDGKERWADTAFVIDPKGEVVFTQGKCVPIQFFEDGEPARTQELWDSPWGKIGICICYDLSYTRVTDELVRQGAKILIVPAMDAMAWGAHEHELHARIAEVRAAEYCMQILRVASSGVTQFEDRWGHRARLGYPEQNVMVSEKIWKWRPPGRMPRDRFWAPVCVVATGFMGLVMLGWKPLRRIWTWRKRWGVRRWPGLRV